MTSNKFDPWDWLGVHCGGFFADVDETVQEVMEHVRSGQNVDDLLGYGPTSDALIRFICTLLCNTDAFEFDDDPTQLRWVGDDRFKTLDQLIDAWDQWYGEHYR